MARTYDYDAKTNSLKEIKGTKVAYTPLTDKEKKAAMGQLFKDLHSGKKGKYMSPGGTRTNISDRH